jgi:hypothetical protein
LEGLSSNKDMVEATRLTGKETGAEGTGADGAADDDDEDEEEDDDVDIGIPGSGPPAVQ